MLARGVLLITCSACVIAQPPSPTYIPQTKFARGQDVQPTYEGWIRNADGSATMVFGYLNRNWEEELAIPAGPNNKLEPGEADRDQPTFFLPRRQPFVFKVQVPKDWGQKELVWTVTANGKSEKAYGQLTPEEEISERMIMSRGNLNPGEDDPNKPPSIAIQPISSVIVGSPVMLTAMVSDDGLPKPRVAPKPRPGAPPAQTNNVGSGRPRGLNVTWMQYRGPAKVRFASTGPILVADGKAETTAHFAVPGTYVLRATANDGELSTRADVTIKVQP